VKKKFQVHESATSFSIPKMHKLIARKMIQVQDIKLSSDLVVYSDLLSQTSADNGSQKEFGRQGGNRCEGALK
jgi:hypothetical protein